MALRFEAWTLPWSTTFERVIADLPAVTGSRGMVRLSDYGEAAIILPEDYARLSDVISSTVGTLIRVFDDTTIIQEFLAERVEHSNRDAGTVTVSGPDLADVFNRTVVYPFDYPLNPSAFPDFVWGGVNTLSNSGFEDGLGTNDVVEVWHDHTGGTFTLTVDAQTTVALAHNVTPTTMELRLQDLSSVNDVTVTGEGTEANPWTVTFFSPTSVTMTGNGSSLTGGTQFSVTETQSAESEAGAWMVSQGADQVIEPRIHGAATISVVTTPVDTGTYSLRIIASEQLGGVQQVIQVEPGGTYQASIRIRSTSTGPFRFVIRDLYENLIAANPSGGSGFTVTANTWTTITIPDVAIPAGVEAVIFRIAYVGTGTQTFYIDNAEFNEGMAATNAGTIVGMLMTDAAVDHAADARGAVLDWVDYTGFTTTLDSSAVAWVDALSITAYAGMTYGQFFDSLVQLGYEWRLTPKATPGATTHDLDLYMTGNLGTDYSSSATPAINFGQGTIGGPVVQRIPAYTRVLTIGADNAFVEDTDATALTNFGPFETSRQDTAWNSTTTLTAAANELLDAESRNRVAVQVSVIATKDHPRPLVSYTVGDTLFFQIPPALPKAARRVRSIAWSHGEPATYQVTGSRIFDAESGAWEAVRRLLREFKKPTPKASGGITLGSNTLPFVVAASNAPDGWKQIAGYVCAGVDDQDTINQALADHVSVLLSPGWFYIRSNPSGYAIDLAPGAAQSLAGSGSEATILYVSESSTFGAVRVHTASTLRDFALYASGATTTPGVVISGAYARVENIYVKQLEYGVFAGIGLVFGSITNCSFDDIGIHAIQVDDCELFTVAHNVVRGCDEDAIHISGGGHNAITGNTLFNVCTDQVGDAGIRVGDRSGATESINITITGNTIHSNDEGIAVDCTTANVGLSIAGNTIQCYNDGIRLSNVIDSVIANNTIRGIYSAISGEYEYDGPGILVSGSSNNSVIGNVTVEPGAFNSNSFDGIMLTGNSDGNTITGNRIVPRTSGNTTRYGINIGTATCDNNVVVGNNLGGSASYGSGPYNNAGTGTINTYTGGAVGDNVSY